MPGPGFGPGVEGDRFARTREGYVSFLAISLW